MFPCQDLDLAKNLKIDQEITFFMDKINFEKGFCIDKGDKQ